jgi:hypothetical protein
MRRAIATVPRDGKLVILEDDASGTYEVACWSAEAHAWVGENGEPSKITPTHWHAMRRDEYFPEQCLSSGPSRSGTPGLLPFSSGGAPQRSSAAGDGIAPHQIPTAPSVTVAVVEEQTASGKAQRGPRGGGR